MFDSSMGTPLLTDFADMIESDTPWMLKCNDTREDKFSEIDLPATDDVLNTLPDGLEGSLDFFQISGDVIPFSY
jgi:hypothetical protein